jgi:hypothetical protein
MESADAAAGTVGGGLRLEVRQGLLWPERLSSCCGGPAEKEALSGELTELGRKTARQAEGANEIDV